MKGQEWLEENYPQGARRFHKTICVSEQLEGELDLVEFESLEKIYVPRSIDKGQFKVKNSSAELVELVNAQEWLKSQVEYNIKEKRVQVTELDISKKGLEGELDLSDFVNLEELDFSHNLITSLNISGCPSIKRINAFNNRIREIIGLEKLVNVQELSLGENELKKLILTNNTNLRTLIFHTNLADRAEIGDTHYLTYYSGENTVLSWEGIKKKELGRLAEELGIKSDEKIEDVSTEKVRELIVEKINDLKNKIQQAENFGLTNWNNLAAQTQNETLTSLLGRPTKDELENAKKERDRRPNITLETWDNFKGRPTLEQYNGRPNVTVEDYNKLLNNQKPADYDSIKADLDKIKVLLGLDKNDPLPVGWENQLVKKDDLEKVQNGLREWTSRFGNERPEDVKKELDNLRRFKSENTVPGAEQQKKIDDLKKMIERQGKAIEKYLHRLDVYTDVKEFKNEVLEFSKDYQKLIK